MSSELTGYTDKLSVRPGEQIQFMVSTDLPNYEVTIVRLIHGDESPKGPGFKEQVIETQVNRQYKGRKQTAHSGSYILVQDNPALAEVRSFTLQAWIMPTTPTIGRVQGLITKWSEADSAGYGLFISENGDLDVTV